MVEVGQLIAGTIVGLVINRLNSRFWKELKLLRGLEEDIERLRSTLMMIADVLADAEKRSIAEVSVRDWLKRLMNAAYDAEDLVDEFETEALRRQIKGRGKFKGQVRDFFSSHNPVIFIHDISHKVKDQLKKLDEIAGDRNKFGLIQGSGSTGMRHEETYSCVIESEVCGRDKEREEIVNALLSENNDKDVSILAIVGLGGAGKTTLAQLVYNDEKVKQGFHPTAWVCVSHEFDVQVIMRKIIHCINKEAKCDHLELEPLSQHLRELLAGKKFFIVLDDVWNEDRGRWEKLQLLLRCGEKGSKIVVTTRSEVVASVMDDVKIHWLGTLQDDDLWKLFSERAFGHGRQEETPRLVEVGKGIVKRCRGLPLAAKALGSVMGSKQGEHEWLDVQTSEMLSFSYNENEILPVLHLSYYYLPSHLKPCFAYCSLFPKDYVFVKKRLINQWFGEGLAQSFDDGERYFNDLSRRSFLDKDETKDGYEIHDLMHDRRETKDGYKMHDLMHDLACCVAGDNFVRSASNEELSRIGDFHHLSMVWNSLPSSTVNLSSVPKKVRTFLQIDNFWRWGESTEINLNAILQLSYIRVLDIRNSNISELPSAICQLKHLRYLDLSSTRIRTLPSAIGVIYNLIVLILVSCTFLERLPSRICRLVKLSTLDLYYCHRSRELPAGLSKMKSLVHLNIEGCLTLDEMPPGLGQLTNLQTMPKFVVGNENGCRITELKHLNKIRGPLKIYKLHRVKSPQEVKEANLAAKVNIKQLELSWSNRDPSAETVATAEEEEAVLEHLIPPPNVEVLTIHDYDGARWPGWMMRASSSLFQNLVALNLFTLKRCEVLPALGGLPSLTSLVIFTLTAIRRLGKEFYYGVGEAEAVRGNFVPFPKLEYLEFSDMDNLEEWLVEADGEIGIGIGIGIERERMFPSLQKLKITRCPKLTRIHPCLPLSVVDMEVGSSSVKMLSAKCLAGLSRLTKLGIRYISSPSSSWGDLGLHHLVALQTLEVRYCDKLTCLPKEMIQHHIPTLRQLTLHSIEKLTWIAGDEWQHEQQPPPLFTSLHTLHIGCCKELTALPDWLAVLTSFQVLVIVRCPKLKMLPDGLQHLTALRQLQILGCPILGRRCEREKGEDWHKIAHIPNLQIDEPTAPTETSETETAKRRRSKLATSFMSQVQGRLPSCYLRSQPAPPSP